MKIVIQIPCYNEEKTLGHTLACLPRKIEGAEFVEWLIIDDGSEDRTIEVAKECGVDHIVRMPYHRGLAISFLSGIKACLDLKANIIVNIDADNQYCAEDIPLLILPILKDHADIVIGARDIENITHFSFAKKKLQRLGSILIRKISGSKVKDATSGFRAMSRKAALRMKVFSEYTYTLETIIQSSQAGLRILSIPIKVNQPLRPSRLFTRTSSYLWHSMWTILRSCFWYHAFSACLISGIVFCLAGFFCLLLYTMFLPYLLFLMPGAICLCIGSSFLTQSFLADQIQVNRRLLEEILEKIERN